MSDGGKDGVVTKPKLSGEGLGGNSDGDGVVGIGDGGGGAGEGDTKEGRECN